MSTRYFDSVLALASSSLSLAISASLPLSSLSFVTRRCLRAADLTAWRSSHRTCINSNCSVVVPKVANSSICSTSLPGLGGDAADLAGEGEC